MDINTSEGPSWKSDYYEQVSDIVVGDPIKKDNITDDIKGSYISDDYLDVTNEKKRHEFSFDKINEEINKNGGHDAVTGATFKLVGPKPSEETKWAYSDESGRVSFKDLLPGTYKLVEHGPAQGYEEANTDWTVTVQKDGKIYLKENNETRSSRNAEVRVGDWSATTEGETPTLYSLVGLSRSAFFSENLEPLDISDKFMGEPVGAGNGWETVYPDKSEGRRTGDLSKAGFGSTRITEVNKDTKRFRQEFTFLQSPFGAKNRTIEIHRQPEEYDLNLTDTNVRVYQLVNGVKQEITSIKFTNKRKNNHNRLVSGNIGTNITGTLIVEVEASYRTTNGIGLGSDYNNNTTAQYDNKTWMTDSYSTEAGINKNLVQEQTYTVSINTDGNGSVTTTKTSNLKQNDSVTLTVQPNNGYELNQLIVDGKVVNVDVNSQYNFNMPASDVTVNATFKQKGQPQPTKHKINTQTPSNGTFTVDKKEAAVGLSLIHI